MVVNATGDITEAMDPVGFFLRAAARRIHQSIRSGQKTSGWWTTTRKLIFKLSNDGKKLLQTIGTPDKSGADAHSFQPADVPHLAARQHHVRSRRLQRDARGEVRQERQVSAGLGQKGNPPTETRPGYFNVVHGIAADPVTHHVYVCDRGNRRIQVFDENGKFLDQWPLDKYSSVNFL